MPFIQTTSGNVYYRLDGAEGQPVVVLSHALGLDHGMWDAQVEALASRFRVLRFDTLGHGASAAPAGEYSIDQLAAGVLTLTDALGIREFAYCGLSLGGMIGLWLGVHAPDRVTHLVLANTTARVSDPAAMDARRQAVIEGGMAAVSDMVMARCFSPASLTQNRPAVAAARRTLLACSPQGYAACCAAIRDMDQRAGLSRIAVPTLVITGDLDVAMPWTGHGAVLASSIPGARVVHLDAAHISSLERPRTFSAALLEFLLPAPTDTHAAGMAVRRAVLGDSHVDRALATATDLDRAFQELITRYAWGSVWTRPGLDHRTRRLVVLAITASMGRWEEFRLHVRAGLDHELEWEDVKEVLLQTAVYAGVPAANTGFHIVKEEQQRRRE